MIKMMPISYQQSFELARNYYNWSWATRMNPWFMLPPMQMNLIKPTNGLTVSEFNVRPITVKGPYKTVGTAESLSTALILWARGTNTDTFYYTGKARLSLSIETGLHEFYVKLSDNSEYISEPFLYVDCGTVQVEAGDYNKTDYGQDYWI